MAQYVHCIFFGRVKIGARKNNHEFVINLNCQFALNSLLSWIKRMCPRACGRRENVYTRDTASTGFSTEDQKAYVFSQKKYLSLA